MGFSPRVLPEHRLGVVALSGRVDASELIEATRRLLDDPAWEPGFRSVWDVRGARVLVLLPEDLPRLAEAQRAHCDRQGPGRSAILARGRVDEITADVLRMRWAGHPGRQLQGFRDGAEAAAWIGVPAELLDRGA
jgi:hypothetical protein